MDLTGPEVLYEFRDHIALITLNRPERLNAVTPGLTEALCQSLERSIQDKAAAVILTGAGRSFCAGHDLKQESNADHSTMRTQDVMRLVRRSPAPVIAAVHGYAVGAGCEFALCSDLVVAGESATFGFPEVSVGLAVTGGISHVLPLTVGPAVAKELILLGEHFTAQRAMDLGLVNVVVDDSHVMTQARTWADRFASLPGEALHGAKRVIDTGMQVDLESAMELERVYADFALKSEQAVELADAFSSRAHARAGES